MLKHGILGLLNYGSMTGYEIDKTFRDSLSYFWKTQTSQIYRELHTLKNKGWASYEVISQEGKPDKKVFSITESGREELNHWLSEDRSEFIVRSSLLMKTFFRGERSIDENIRYFDNLKTDGESFLKGLMSSPPKTEDYSQMISDPVKAVYWKMTVGFGIMYARMYCDWAEKCKKELEDLKNEGFGD